MKKSAYFATSAILGVFWGGLGYWLMRSNSTHLEWATGGLLVSPAIGVLAGLLYLPAYSRRLGVRVLAAGVTLYITAACFAAAGGLYHMVSLGIDPRAAFGRVWVPRGGGVSTLGSSFITTPVLGTLWGLTFAG